MSYTTDSARRRILEDSARAADHLGGALAVLGEVYEQLDEGSADRLEEVVFKPLAAGYGQLQRTLADFAARSGLPGRQLATGDPGRPGGDPRVRLEMVADALAEADATLADLQDSLLPVEVGDRELREGLSRARSLIAPLPSACDSFIRTVGR
jgi:hypothetical protein